MHKHIFTVLVLLAMIMFTPTAFALTIDRDSDINTDGTAKFSDPDDQMPGFMTPPSNAPGSPQATPSIGLPMSPSGGSNMNFSVNRFGVQPQPNAFDQAFDNK
jgi:hypothetical protein